MSQLMNVCGVFMDMWGGFELAENQSKEGKAPKANSIQFKGSQVEVCQ